MAIPKIDHVVAIEAGEHSTCAIKDDATVWCWGKGAEGELGNGTAPTSSVDPVEVVDFGGKPILASRLFGSRTGGGMCALTPQGASSPNPLCWGPGSFGRLGNQTLADSLVALPATPLR